MTERARQNAPVNRTFTMRLWLVCPIEGMLTRYNKKTVTVVTDEGRQWNVSPTFLSKAVPPKGKSSAGSNVVLLSKR
ncbi:MAG TPA: hypothetical protein VE420_11320 [Gemmatimonadales bacterium]|nr:hypothetical protein [Gemmatimonadales bacterium]